MDWAERGLKTFPNNTDERLMEFLADEYHRRKRHDEAMQLIWKVFTERASLESFQILKKHADRVVQWPAWREKALAFIRADIERERKNTERKPKGLWAWNAYVTDHSLLVAIFLWEKDAESAWREAQTGGCHNSWWMELAAKREVEFPADAI